jgi:hypothetical protein
MKEDERMPQKRMEDIITPVGTLVYPNFNTPRDYKGDGKFKYDGKLLLTGADAEALKSRIEQLSQETLGKSATKLPYPLWEDKVDENGSEFTLFTLKVNAEGKSKSGRTFSNKPIFLDEEGLPFIEEPQIGGGTRASIALRPYVWNQRGITLQPVAIQVIELVEQQRRDAAHYASQFAAAAGDRNPNANPAPRSAAAGSGADF